jgi:quercetin dioxygenase-like cupin family protein
VKRFVASLTVVAFSAMAGVALAQQAPAPKRTQLQKGEYPENHVTLMHTLEAAPNTPVPQHTHPGVETGYILEGEIELVIEGQPPQKLSAGQSFMVPANAVHGGKVLDKPAKLVIVYVVDKNKPLATFLPKQ